MSKLSRMSDWTFVGCSASRGDVKVTVDDDNELHVESESGSDVYVPVEVVLTLIAERIARSS
jgi:hypothetical protein